MASTDRNNNTRALSPTAISKILDHASDDVLAEAEAEENEEYAGTRRGWRDKEKQVNE